MELQAVNYPYKTVYYNGASRNYYDIVALRYSNTPLLILNEKLAYDMGITDGMPLYSFMNQKMEAYLQRSVENSIASCVSQSDAMYHEKDSFWNMAAKYAGQHIQHRAVKSKDNVDISMIDVDEVCFKLDSHIRCTYNIQSEYLNFPGKAYRTAQHNLLRIFYGDQFDLILAEEHYHKDTAPPAYEILHEINRFLLNKSRIQLVTYGGKVIKPQCMSLPLNAASIFSFENSTMKLNSQWFADYDVYDIKAIQCNKESLPIDVSLLANYKLSKSEYNDICKTYSKWKSFDLDNSIYCRIGSNLNEWYVTGVYQGYGMFHVSESLIDVRDYNSVIDNSYLRLHGFDGVANTIRHFGMRYKMILASCIFDTLGYESSDCYCSFPTYDKAEHVLLDYISQDNFKSLDLYV